MKGGDAHTHGDAGDAHGGGPRTAVRAAANGDAKPPLAVVLFDDQTDGDVDNVVDTAAVNVVFAAAATAADAAAATDDGGGSDGGGGSSDSPHHGKSTTWAALPWRARALVALLLLFVAWLGASLLLVGPAFRSSASVGASLVLPGGGDPLQADAPVERETAGVMIHAALQLLLFQGWAHGVLHAFAPRALAGRWRAWPDGALLAAVTVGAIVALHAAQGAARGGTGAQEAALRRAAPVPARDTGRCAPFPDAARGFKPGFCRGAARSNPYFGTLAARNWTRVLGDASDMDTFMSGIDVAFIGLQFMVDIPAVKEELQGNKNGCFDDTRLLVCEAFFPRCTSGCKPRRLCRSACAGFRARCPATVQALPSVVPGDSHVTNSSRDITSQEGAVGNSPAKAFYDFFAVMLSDLDQESLGTCKRSKSGVNVVLQEIYAFFASVYAADGGTPSCLADSPLFSDDDDCIGLEELQRGIPSQAEARKDWMADGDDEGGAPPTSSNEVASSASAVEACSLAWGPTDGFGTDPAWEAAVRARGDAAARVEADALARRRDAVRTRAGRAALAVLVAAAPIAVALWRRRDQRDRRQARDRAALSNVSPAADGDAENRDDEDGGKEKEAAARKRQQTSKEAAGGRGGGRGEQGSGEQGSGEQGSGEQGSGEGSTAMARAIAHAGHLDFRGLLTCALIDGLALVSSWFMYFTHQKNIALGALEIQLGKGGEVNTTSGSGVHYPFAVSSVAGVVFCLHSLLYTPRTLHSTARRSAKTMVPAPGAGCCARALLCARRGWHHYAKKFSIRAGRWYAWRTVLFELVEVGIQTRALYYFAPRLGRWWIVALCGAIATNVALTPPIYAFLDRKDVRVYAVCLDILTDSGYTVWHVAAGLKQIAVCRLETLHDVASHVSGLTVDFQCESAVWTMGDAVAAAFPLFMLAKTLRDLNYVLMARRAGTIDFGRWKVFRQASGAIFREIADPRQWWRKKRVLPCLLSIALGTAFFAYLLSSTVVTGDRCARELGADFYARCSPQIIWGAGSFGARPRCRYDRVLEVRLPPTVDLGALPAAFDGANFPRLRYLDLSEANDGDFEMTRAFADRLAAFPALRLLGLGGVNLPVGDLRSNATVDFRHAGLTARHAVAAAAFLRTNRHLATRLPVVFSDEAACCASCCHRCATPAAGTKALGFDAAEVAGGRALAAATTVASTTRGESDADDDENAENAEIAEIAENGDGGVVGDDVWLRLADRALGDVGTALVAELLAGNRVATAVNLRSNCIGPTGAAALAHMLAANARVQYLDVRQNPLTNAGAVGAIARAAVAQGRVATLRVGARGFGDGRGREDFDRAGLTALLRAAGNASALTFLEWQSEPVAARGAWSRLWKTDVVDARKLGTRREIALLPPADELDVNEVYAIGLADARLIAALLANRRCPLLRVGLRSLPRAATRIILGAIRGNAALRPYYYRSDDADVDAVAALMRARPDIPLTILLLGGCHSWAEARTMIAAVAAAVARRAALGAAWGERPCFELVYGMWHCPPKKPPGAAPMLFEKLLLRLQCTGADARAVTKGFVVDEVARAFGAGFVVNATGNLVARNATAECPKCPNALPNDGFVVDVRARGGGATGAASNSVAASINVMCRPPTGEFRCRNL